MRITGLCLLGAAALLAGCETVSTFLESTPGGISASDCRAADWGVVGEIDGLRGKPPERIDKYRVACEGYGVIPDPVAYERGRLAGAAAYCTPEQAYVEGRAGRDLRPGACPNATPERQAAYTHGATYRRLRRELEALNARDAGLDTAGSPGVDFAGSRAPLYARPEFNPVSPRRRAALEAELRRYASWPPEG